jgi:transposase
MTKKRQYKTYPKEFKEEAVALVTEQGYSVPEAAKAVGVTDKLIYNWKKKFDDENTGKLLSTEEKSELLSLRKEVKKLRIEKEILKKASAFFAREMK